MNWDAIGAIGELIGATVVALTLIYLVIQTRQNSASIHANTNQMNLSGFNQINIVLAENPKLAAIVEKGTVAPETLSDEENYSFTWIIRSYMNLYLSLFDQYRAGTCPEFLWQRHARDLKTMLGNPGFQAFLKIDDSYRELYTYVEALPEFEAHAIGLRLGDNEPKQDKPQVSA